ncbi:uncharacterized protein [Argopecten irradians]|uniref:uncharacterized protein n=1 Tax=Argopecten irradians TaxID=31199 RepID=UPI00371CB734
MEVSQDSDTGSTNGSEFFFGVSDGMFVQEEAVYGRQEIVDTSVFQIQDLFQLPTSGVEDENGTDCGNHGSSAPGGSEEPDVYPVSDIGSTFRSENFEEMRKSLEEICASITTSEEELNGEFEEPSSPKHSNTFPTSSHVVHESRPLSVQSQPDTASKASKVTLRDT